MSFRDDFFFAGGISTVQMSLWRYAKHNRYKNARIEEGRKAHAYIERERELTANRVERESEKKKGDE